MKNKTNSQQRYRHNHYVPRWYQQRFMREGQHKYWYLDLHPETIRSGSSIYTRKELLHWGPAKCFAQDDLYTTAWGSVRSTEIEQFFFGKLDAEGNEAVDYFNKFKHPSASQLFNAFIRYMSVQKLRTPKGLGHLRQFTKTRHKHLTLLLLQQLQNMNSAIWTECVWQLADATDSPTKFIVSDHPVTVYNRDCPPLSAQCQGVLDPDIRRVGTHTYFPLSLERVLILTNLSWVRNPYQSALKIRPNPKFFHDTMFNYTKIQTDRKLSEQEVIEINWIAKLRARRYIAAAEKEWLYPERRLKNPHWRKLGDGYLLMPDPRHVNMGGSVVVGYDSGRSDAFNEYGQRPGEQGYKNDKRDRKDGEALTRFKGEWSAMMGQQYRGVCYDSYSNDRPVRTSASDDTHKHYLEVHDRYRKRPGERQRRRRLKR